MNRLIIILVAAIFVSADFSNNPNDNNPVDLEFAEDFTLWVSDTFNSPYVEGVVARSAEFQNPSGFLGLQIAIDYLIISPKPCNCQLSAVVEEEVAAGVWIPTAGQHQVISSDDNAPLRKIVISETINSNPGVDEFIAVGDGMRVSHTQASVPDKFRVTIYNRDTGSEDLLNQLVVTGYGRKF